ncbi:MAG: DNA-directed RNA polymerase subunit H [Nanobdellota archaeon]
MEKLDHDFIPKHEKIEQKEKEEFLKKYNTSLQSMPKIAKKDPAIAHLDVKVGDIIKITRKSETAGETVFFRGVVNE